MSWLQLLPVHDSLRLQQRSPPHIEALALPLELVAFTESTGGSPKTWYVLHAWAR